MLGNFILIIPGNREDSILIPTRELTEYISALFLLLSSAVHTRINQYGIYDNKENDGDDNTMDSKNKSKSLFFA